MSDRMSSYDALAASRFAVRSTAPRSARRVSSERTISRQRRFIRLRTTARGETFFETTHAAWTPPPLGEGAIVKEKYAPLNRLRGERPMISKSRRESLLALGIRLDRKSGTTLSSASLKKVGPALCLGATQKSVSSGAFPLFWLPRSSHGATILKLSITSTPAERGRRCHRPVCPTVPISSTGYALVPSVRGLFRRSKRHV